MNENIVIKIFTMKKTITTLSLIFVVTICTYAVNVSADTLTVYLQPHISQICDFMVSLKMFQKKRRAVTALQ